MRTKATREHFEYLSATGIIDHGLQLIEVAITCRDHRLGDYIRQNIRIAYEGETRDYGTLRVFRVLDAVAIDGKFTDEFCEIAGHQWFSDQFLIRDDIGLFLPTWGNHS